MPERSSGRRCWRPRVGRSHDDDIPVQRGRRAGASQARTPVGGGRSRNRRCAAARREGLGQDHLGPRPRRVDGRRPLRRASPRRDRGPSRGQHRCGGGSCWRGGLLPPGPAGRLARRRSLCRRGEPAGRSSRGHPAGCGRLRREPGGTRRDRPSARGPLRAGRVDEPRRRRTQTTVAGPLRAVRRGSGAIGSHGPC